jgi:hypothetical protein
MRKTFNKEAFRAAAAQVTGGKRDKWMPSEEGLYLCEFVKMKESEGEKGQFHISELKVIMGPEGTNCEGKEFSLFVKLDATEEANVLKDYAKIKALSLAAIGGFPGDDEAEELATDLYESSELLSERSYRKFVKGKSQAEKVTETLPGKAVGGLVVVKVTKSTGKDKKTEEDRTYINYYPRSVELEEGYTTSPTDYSKAIGPNGEIVKRLDVVAAA